MNCEQSIDGISVTMELSEDDALAMNLHCIRSSGTIRARRRKTLIISIFVTITCMMGVYSSDAPMEFLPWVSIFLGVYWFLILRAITRNPRTVVRSMLREGQNRGLFGPRVVTITPRDVRELWRNGESRWHWEIIERVEATRDYVFILTSAHGGLPVPRRAFDSDAEFQRFADTSRRFHAAVAPGTCKKCGHDLTGTTQDRCPECGQAFVRFA